MSIMNLDCKKYNITDNSKEVDKNTIFFAVKGTSKDGHDFIDEAIEKGAPYVVAEHTDKDYKNIVLVEDSKKAFGECVKKHFDNPDESLKVIGVTGTNGKTSTTHIIHAILSQKYKGAIIGTMYYKLGDEIIEAPNTTPGVKTWFNLLSKAKEKGLDFVSAEVSSHALDQLRVYPTKFFATIFTNLTQDHLDYHKTMENYFNAKRRLFKDYQYDVCVINIDDEYGKRLYEEFKDKAITYGYSKDAHLQIEYFNQEDKLLSFYYKNKRYTLKTNLMGAFQAYNMSASILLSLYMDFDIEDIQNGLLSLSSIPGRFETIDINGVKVVIDYAHTPDALEKLLKTARAITKSRLICVFGAGGNRDKTKRPKMGKIASELSDISIITSDNPRFEEPMDIIKDILKGIDSSKGPMIEEDRRKAIALALDIAKEGDVVVIAGKGHEDYQEIKGVKYHFSDKEEVLKYKINT
ncbi:MAG: UDP-N-acetylmuramoyl-L-alanyl-D-glutamate--2,6-diaminopimelate ligase [Hydrogenobaculum sp.]|nr:MAG: UDP-N-acetylmuramoyl-L-alanyl-D-glutamate--2,6-diaminopimelate ligase [Hydrogenobaculum sp.]